MAAGAVVRHITWDLRQSRLCMQMCSARGLRYLTGLSDLTTEGARRQLQVMQREYPSIQQVHVVLDETLPQQLMDDLPGLIAEHMDCEVVVLEWGTFRHLEPHYTSEVAPEERALPARVPAGWLVPLGRYPGVALLGEKWNNPISTTQLQALVAASADRPQMLVLLSSNDGRPLPPWPRPAPAPPSQPRTPHPLVAAGLCQLPLGCLEAGVAAVGRWRAANACKWDGEAAKEMLKQQQQLEALRYDAWSPGVFSALKGLRTLDTHHFILTSTEELAAVDAPLPPALQHLTLHCNLSEHGIQDWQFWPRTFSSLSPLQRLRSLCLAGLKPAHVNLLQMGSATCLTRLEIQSVLASPSGRSLVDGYQRLVCDCTLEYALIRMPLLVSLQLVSPGCLYGFGIREPRRLWDNLPRLQVLALEGVQLSLLPRQVYTELHAHGGDHNRHITKAIRQQWPGQAVANAIQGAVGKDSVSRYQRWHNPISCWTPADLDGDPLVAPGHTPGDDDAVTPANAAKERQLRALEQQRRREGVVQLQQVAEEDPLHGADWGSCQHRAGCMRMDLPLWLLPRNLRWLSLARYSLVLPPDPPPGLFDCPVDPAAAAAAAAGGGRTTVEGFVGAGSSSSSSRSATAPGHPPPSSRNSRAAGSAGACVGSNSSRGGPSNTISSSSPAAAAAAAAGSSAAVGAAGGVPSVGDLLGHNLRGLCLKDCLIVRPQLVPAPPTPPGQTAAPTTAAAAGAGSGDSAGGPAASDNGGSSSSGGGGTSSSPWGSAAPGNSSNSSSSSLPKQRFPVELAPIQGLACWVSISGFLQQLGPQPHLSILRLIGMPVSNTDVPAVAAYGASLRELSLAVAPQELPCDDGKAALWYDRFKGALPQPKYHGAGCLSKTGLEALVAGLAAASRGDGVGGGCVTSLGTSSTTTTSSSRSAMGGRQGGTNSSSRQGNDSSSGNNRRRRSRRPGGAQAGASGSGGGAAAAGGGSHMAGATEPAPGNNAMQAGAATQAAAAPAAPAAVAQQIPPGAAAAAATAPHAAAVERGGAGAAAAAAAAAAGGGGVASGGLSDPVEPPVWVPPTKGGSLAPPLRTLILFGTRACLPLADTGALLPLASLCHLTNLIVAVGPKMDVVDHTMVEVLWQGGRWQVVSSPDSLERNQAALAPLYAGLPVMRHGRVCLI